MESYTEPVDSAPKDKKTTSFSSIDLANWREYGHIETDSLWLLGKRDRSGAHTGDYHGNFVPQIPQQIIERFSKVGDWVIDPFSGSGTTLIEAQRLGRNAVGIELSDEMVEVGKSRVESEKGSQSSVIESIIGDSTLEKAWDRASSYLPTEKEGRFDLAILHPPYHDMLKFNDDPRCLSNQATKDGFLDLFGKVIRLTGEHLAPKRFLALVIGDKYERGELVPLGFLCMSAVLEAGFQLKSIIVKDIQDNRAKRNLENLWRVRALKGGFYIFKHEYVFIFQRS